MIGPYDNAIRMLRAIYLPRRYFIVTDPQERL